MKRRRSKAELIITIMKEHEADVSVAALSRCPVIAESPIRRQSPNSGGIEVSEARWLRELDRRSRPGRCSAATSSVASRA